MATHFGQTLRRLRQARGLTQAQLAAAAGVAKGTIQQGEQMETCTWWRTHVADVLRALQKTAPLSDEDAAAYYEGAGMTAMVAMAKKAMEQLEEQRRLLGPPAEEQTAHMWVDALIASRGVRNVLTALEGLAAGWDVDLPPRRREDDKGPRWVEIHTEFEGHRVRTINPIPDPAAPAKPAQRSATQ